MIELDQITPDLIGESWWVLEPLIARSIARSPDCDLTTEFIRSEAAASRHFVWAIYERENPLPLLGVAVTGVRDEDGIRICECFAMSGRRFAEWAELALARFEKMARAHGVQKIVFSGRRGCQRNRTYQRLGFTLVGSVMEKCLV